MKLSILDFSPGLAIWEILILLFIAVWVYSLVDILRNQFHKNDKIIWLLAVILVPILGAIFYVILGRKKKLKLN